MAKKQRRLQDNPRAAAPGMISVVRALGLLEVLGAENFGLTLSEISRRLKTNKQVVVRLLETLASCGFIYKNSATDTFHLSYKLSKLGMRTLLQQRILEQSSTIIRDLSNKTGELVRLAVVEDGGLNWVLGATGKQRSLHIDSNFVPKISLHTTATGKAWLSTMDKDRVRAMLKQSDMAKMTPKSITDLHELEDELNEVRRRGFALSVDESEMGVGAVAAPVIAETIGGQANCVGTVSVSAPTSRMPRQELERIAPLVIEATKRLGDMWPQAETSELAAPQARSLHWV